MGFQGVVEACDVYIDRHGNYLLTICGAEPRWWSCIVCCLIATLAVFFFRFHQAGSITRGRRRWGNRALHEPAENEATPAAEVG